MAEPCESTMMEAWETDWVVHSIACDVQDSSEGPRFLL